MRVAGVYLASMFAISCILIDRNVLGDWWLAASTTAVAFGIAAYRRKMKTNLDELLVMAGALGGLALVGSAWSEMGGGWIFVFGAILLLLVGEFVNPQKPVRAASRREVAEWALAGWKKELSEVGWDSPRGLKCREEIERTETQLSKFGDQWDAEDARARNR